MAKRIGIAAMVVLVSAAAFGQAASRLGSIAGQVRDSSGAPLMGAAVQVFTLASPLAATIYTDSEGRFQLKDLLPGSYQVKVSSARFLPALRENVLLRTGARQIVNVTLNTLAEAIELMPARKAAGQDNDDWKWTLRSAANRPILRVVDDSPVLVAAETAGDPGLKAHVAILAAGGDGGPFAEAGEMTSFTLEHSLFSSGTLSFNGNVGYNNESGLPWTVVRAGYSHRFADGSEPQLAVTVRNFASPTPMLRDAGLQAISFSMRNSTTVLNSVELNYGGDVQSISFLGRDTAFRPYAGATLHLNDNTLVEYRYATSRPTTRLSKGFDSAPADLSESDPRLTLAGGAAQAESARHQEVSVSRRLGDATTVEAAAYLDEVSNLALTGVGDFGGVDALSGEVLPDVYAGTFGYNGGQFDTDGMRVVVQRKLLPDSLTATMDFGYGGALDLAVPNSLDGLRNALACRRREAVAWRLEGRAPRTGTRWQASYRWTSGRSLTPVDMFNASPGQMDPYLNIFIRQPLPGPLAGRMEAIIDLKNLLAQGYVPVMAGDGHTVYMVQSARAVRGGLAFTF